MEPGLLAPGMGTGEKPSQADLLGAYRKVSGHAAEAVMGCPEFGRGRHAAKRAEREVGQPEIFAEA